MSDQIEQSQSIFKQVIKFKSSLPRQLGAMLFFAWASVFTAPHAQASELVIISSSGNDYKVGQVVDSAADIKLAKEATLTLISQNGKVIALKGPHTGPLQVEKISGDEGSLIPSLKNIISGDKTEAGSLGVMRSVGTSAIPENPWAIIASKTGNYCVSTSKSVVLWRPDSQKTSNLILMNVDNEAEVKTVWHAGQNDLHWPRLLPLIDGATYRVDITGESKLPKLSIRLVPDQPSSAHAAVWMAEHGCKKQALRLIGSIR